MRAQRIYALIAGWDRCAFRASASCVSSRSRISSCRFVLKISNHSVCVYMTRLLSNRTAPMHLYVYAKNALIHFSPKNITKVIHPYLYYIYYFFYLSCNILIKSGHLTTKTKNPRSESRDSRFSWPLLPTFVQKRPEFDQNITVAIQNRPQMWRFCGDFVEILWRNYGDFVKISLG